MGRDRRREISGAGGIIEGEVKNDAPGGILPGPVRQTKVILFSEAPSFGSRGKLFLLPPRLSLEVLFLYHTEWRAFTMRYLLVALLAFGLAGTTRSGQTLTPNNLTAVNTDKDEDDPHSTVNANTNLGQLFYTSSGALYTDKKTAQGWQPGKKSTDFNQRGDIRSVFVAFPKTGNYPQTFFYAANTDSAKKDDRGDNFDLYMLVR